MILEHWTKSIDSPFLVNMTSVGGGEELKFIFGSFKGLFKNYLTHSGEGTGIAIVLCQHKGVRA